MYLRFSHVVAGVSTSVLFLTEWHPTVWMDHICSSDHLLTDTGVASTFWGLWTGLLWTFTYRCFFLWTLMYFSWLFSSREITESHGNSIFSLWRNFRTIFHSSWTTLRSHRQHTRFPVSPRLPHLLLGFVMMAILTDVRWYLTVVLICISLKSNAIEHLFLRYWPPARLLCRHVCSDPLPIFNWLFAFILLSSKVKGNYTSGVFFFFF